MSDSPQRPTLARPLPTGLAFLAGGGFMLMALSLALGVISDNAGEGPGMLFVSGLIMLVCGIIAWFFATRPDTHFDDIDQPQNDAHH